MSNQYIFFCINISMDFMHGKCFPNCKPHNYLFIQLTFSNLEFYIYAFNQQWNQTIFKNCVCCEYFFLWLSILDLSWKTKQALSWFSNQRIMTYLYSIYTAIILNESKYMGECTYVTHKYYTILCVTFENPHISVQELMSMNIERWLCFPEICLYIMLVKSYDS